MSNRGNPEQTLQFGPRIQPTPNQIAVIANQIKSLLFHNAVYCFGLSALITLLNNVSKSKFAPQEAHGILYGECVASIVCAQRRLHKMGVKGGKSKQQQKEAITSSLLRFNGANKLHYNNKKLIRAILPHKTRRNQNNMIKKCMDIATAFDGDQSTKDLCLPHDPLTRERMPRLIINSFLKKWTLCTNPSPSRYDKRLMKDRNGNTVKDHNGDRISRQLRTHSQDQKDIYAEWKIELKNEIDELIAQGILKKVPCIDTMKKYKPTEIRKCQIINHMACDKCCAAEFVFEALTSVFARNHSCSDDSTCYINILKRINWRSRHSFPSLFCASSNSIFPHQTCADDECSECGTNRLYELLHHFTGCSTLDISAVTQAEYTYKTLVKVDQSKSTSLFIAHLNVSFDEFRRLAIDTMKTHIRHLFDWKKQENFKDTMIGLVDEQMPLRFDDLMISMDFISNYHIPANKIPVGMGTKRMEIQMCVIDECRVIPDPDDDDKNKISQSAHVAMSDNSNHGWYSAIPILDEYLDYRLQELKAINIDINRLIFWSDRGPKDFWTAPFFGHLQRVCKSRGLCVLDGTSCALHGKDYHDQIGGTAVRKLNDAFCNNKIKLNPYQPISMQIVDFLNKKFAVSLDGNLQRNFYWIAEDKITHANSPIKPIKTKEYKGITSYHCCLITPDGLYFRSNSCSCTECLSRCTLDGWKYDENMDCSLAAICGSWSVIGKAVDMPTYDELKPKQPKKKKQRVEIGKKQEILICPHCKKEYKSRARYWYDKHVAKCNNTNMTQREYLKSRQ